MLLASDAAAVETCTLDLGGGTNHTENPGSVSSIESRMQRGQQIGLGTDTSCSVQAQLLRRVVLFSDNTHRTLAGVASG